LLAAALASPSPCLPPPSPRPWSINLAMQSYSSTNKQEKYYPCQSNTKTYLGRANSSSWSTPSLDLNKLSALPPASLTSLSLLGTNHHPIYNCSLSSLLLLILTLLLLILTTSPYPHYFPLPSHSFMLSGEYTLVLTPVASQGWIHLSQLKDPLSQAHSTIYLSPSPSPPHPSFCSRQLPTELRDRILQLSTVKRAFPDSNFVPTHTSVARTKLKTFLNDDITIRVAFPTSSVILHRDDPSSVRSSSNPQVFTKADPTAITNLITVQDPDLHNINPVEAKHIKLNSSRSVYEDADLRPNSDEKQALTLILARPPTHRLSQAEKDMIWKFRMYLSAFKKVLEFI